MLRHALSIVAALGTCGAHAGQTACHVTYGGQTQAVDVPVVSSPYAVRGIEFGSYFIFRALIETEPPELAAVKVYVYVDRDSGPAPIHQAVYPYPPPAARREHGFTGLHRVYEPIRDSELEYWCGATEVER